VAVDGAVIHIDLIVIGHIHQLIAAFHKAGALRQRLKQQEFRHRQRHIGCPFQVHGMAQRIHHAGCRAP
jgi:hypothetical protein